MKKIGIYLGSSPSCGGTHQYNQLIVDALSQMHEYEIIAFYSQEHWEDYFKNKTIKTQRVMNSIFSKILIGFWRRTKLPLTLWRKVVANRLHPLAKAMKNEACDLWIFPSQDAYAYWMPVKALSTIHDLMHRYETRFLEVGSKSEFAKREFHYKNMCRFSEGILVDSVLGKKHVIESYSVLPQKCHVLPFIASREIDKVISLNFDNKYILPKKYLFYPAQFWAHKNHKNLIEALSMCLSEIPDMQLVLVGSKKNNFDEIVNLIKKRNLSQSVHILGLVDAEDIPEFYRRARALLMPTFFGPTNIPPLEAWALKCPVGISDIYAIKEQLGNAAIYFNPESIDDIADKMKKLWSDDKLCQILVKKGSERHNQKNFKEFSFIFHNIIKNTLNC